MAKQLTTNYEPRTTKTMDLQLATVAEGANELETIAARVSQWHTVCVRSGQMFHLSRFLIGRELLRARELLGTAKGKTKRLGMMSHGETSPNDSEREEPKGFLKWEREQFPHISNGTLARYRVFAQQVLEQHPEMLQQELLDVRTVDPEAETKLLAAVSACAASNDTKLAMEEMGVVKTPRRAFARNWKWEEWLRKSHPDQYDSQADEPLVREPECAEKLGEKAFKEWRKWIAENEKPRDMDAVERADVKERIKGIIREMHIFVQLDQGTLAEREMLGLLEEGRLTLGNYLKGFKLGR